MQAHIIENGKVTNTIEVESLDVFPDWNLVDAALGGAIGESYDEATGRFTTPAPVVNPDDLVKQKDGVVQARLDGVARSFGYGDPNRPEISPILHAISYADEPAVPRFQAEGRALRAWRSLTWAAAAQIMNAVIAGERDIPSDESLLAELEAKAPAPKQDPL